jgi:hypothetical protein
MPQYGERGTIIHNIIDEVSGAMVPPSLEPDHQIYCQRGRYAPETILKRMEAADSGGNSQEEDVQIAVEPAH